MQAAEKKFWFPAKKYGWGWGPPTCWQGWAVFAAWIGLVIAGTLLMPHIALYAVYTGLLTLALFLICLLKGEKPRWRWGKN